MLNPQLAAQLMESATVTPQMQMLADTLRRGGVALGSSVPALANSQK
jgi:hypothetical protein